MASISPGFPPLSLDVVSLYLTKDPLLDNLPFLIFYGPSTVDNATQSGSRIQAHICSLAGFRSFPRLTVAPSSPLYAAVNHLPAELQGDEVYRGLAVSLLNYFAGLSQATKDGLKVLVERHRADHRAPAMFDEMHAGDLVARMVKVDGTEAILKYLLATFSQQRISWTDVDLILPPRTIERTMTQGGIQQSPALGDDGLPLFNYGPYGAIIDNFGCPAFLPTSKLKRAPSRPTAHSKTRSLQKEQKIALRRELCELLDTERRYVDKMDDLVNVVALNFRQCLLHNVQDTALQKATMDQLFPTSLTQILEVNAEFYQELQDVLSKTEDEAINDIEEVIISDLERVDITSRKRDPTGTLTCAKVLLRWFPRFISPYQDYMRTSTDLPRVLIEARSDNNSEIAAKLNEIGEQKLRSMLIEPVQRLPRYSLLLDNMINQLPALHPAMSSLLRARDVIADICALDQDNSTNSTRASDSLRKLTGNWPTWLSPRGRLITAADALELDPPYEVSSSARQVILLLFPDTLIVIRRKNINATSARGILAEIDRPPNASSSFSDEKNLSFSDAFDISKVRLSESVDGRLIRVINVTGTISQIQASQTNSANLESQVKCFALLGSYEFKAVRLSEEIAKARIEGRFSEAIRESDKWALRNVESKGGSIGLVAALSETDSTNDNTAMMASSRIRVYIGGDVVLKTVLAQSNNLEVAANVTPLDSGSFRLDIEGTDGSRRTDTSDNEGFAQVLVANCRFSLNVCIEQREC